MSLGLFVIGVVILFGVGFLPDSEVRTGVGVIALACILASSLLRERAP